MIARIKERVSDGLRLLHLSARLVAGRNYWIAPLLPLLWIGFQVFRLAVGWRPIEYGPADAQTILIGFPLTVLAVAFGGRVIAGEMDLRTLEIAYTVPGGAHRVWLAKLSASLLLLITAEALLAAATFLFCTDFPLGALYGALQAATFYMVLSMGFSVLFKGEAVGALLTCVFLVGNLFLHGIVPVASPFYNAEARLEFEALDVVAETVRNRIGYLLAIAAVTALSFGRAESREKIL
jgi:hypothetical protein